MKASLQEATTPARRCCAALVGFVVPHLPGTYHIRPVQPYVEAEDYPNALELRPEWKCVRSKKRLIRFTPARFTSEVTQ